MKTCGSAMKTCGSDLWISLWISMRKATFLTVGGSFFAVCALGALITGPILLVLAQETFDGVSKDYKEILDASRIINKDCASVNKKQSCHIQATVSGGGTAAATTNAPG